MQIVLDESPHEHAQQERAQSPRRAQAVLCRQVHVATDDGNPL